jgi:co-chaperonin GroES (HSP10)
MKAYGKHILIQPEPLQPATYGLATTAAEQNKTRYQPARVLSVGHLVEKIEENQRVVFDMVQGSDIRLDGKQFRLIEERHCIATLDEDEKFG